jgi:hypothetical protein
MKQEQKHFIFGGEKVSFGLPLSSEQYLEAKHLQLELKGTLLLLKQIEVSFWWVFNRKHFKLDLTRVFEYVEFKNFKFKFTYKDKLKKLSNVSRKMLKQNPLKTKLLNITQAWMYYFGPWVWLSWISNWVKRVKLGFFEWFISFNGQIDHRCISFNPNQISQA